MYNCCIQSLYLFASRADLSYTDIWLVFINDTENSVQDPQQKPCNMLQCNFNPDTTCFRSTGQGHDGSTAEGLPWTSDAFSQRSSCCFFVEVLEDGVRGTDPYLVAPVAKWSKEMSCSCCNPTVIALVGWTRISPKLSVYILITFY